MRETCNKEVGVNGSGWGAEGDGDSNQKVVYASKKLYTNRFSKKYLENTTAGASEMLQWIRALTALVEA